MFGPGGMPRSKHQQALDDMLTSSPDVHQAPLPGGRTNTMQSLSGNGGGGGGRTRTSSMSSKNFFSGWKKKNNNNFEDDGYMGDELIDDFGHQNNNYYNQQQQQQDSEMSMDSLKSLRDRDRYPTLSSASNKDRTMSINSMSSSFDTAPIIPTFKADGTNQNNQYRKNLTNARKQAMRGPQQPPLSPQMYDNSGPLPPPGPPNGFGGGGGGPRRGGGPPRPSSRNTGDSRLQSMTEHPHEERMQYPHPPPGPNSPRAMSMDKTPPMNYNGPRFSNGNGPPPPRRVSMVSKGTMTEPGPEPEPQQQQKRSSLISEEEVDDDDDGIPKNIVASTNGLMTPDSGQGSNKSIENSLNPELAKMNKSLFDEINVVTNELADVVRRELGLEPNDQSTNATSNTSAQIVQLQHQLNEERKKRLLAESHVQSMNSESEDKDPMKALFVSYDSIDMEQKLKEKDQIIQKQKSENSQLNENMENLQQKFESLQDETNQLKNGILPELKSHVEDLEVLTSTGNPIELIKEVDELKVENVKLQKLVEEQSTRGPLGEKVKSVEAQRDALREAFRSLREKKDHEIRQHNERIRNLELRLDKERVINSQIQRNNAQTNNNRSISSPINVSSSQKNNASTSSTSSFASTLSSPIENTTATTTNNQLSIPRRRGLTVPGIVPPSGSMINDNQSNSRPNTPSPISFEISQEPAWLDYVDPSKLPPQHQRQTSATNSERSNGNGSTGSLSLPNGRTEALPLSLCNNT